jgi:hypothetical protein
MTRVSAEYFSVLGAKMALGRTFSSNEDRPGGPPAAVVSAAVRNRRFRGDPGVIGRTIPLNNGSYRVVGVLAAGAIVYPEADFWLPLQADESSSDHVSGVRVLGRLKPGTSLLAAQNDVGRTKKPFLQKYPPTSPSEAPLIPSPTLETHVKYLPRPKGDTGSRRHRQNR